MLPNRATHHNYANFESCLMKGACLTENVLHSVKISCENEKYKPKLYKGIWKTTFKKLYINHQKSFNEETTGTIQN